VSREGVGCLRGPRGKACRGPDLESVISRRGKERADSVIRTGEVKGVRTLGEVEERISPGEEGENLLALSVNNEAILGGRVTTN